MRSRIVAVLVALFVGSVGVGTVDAAPIVGATFFATGGPVTATFIGSGAFFDSELYLFDASLTKQEVTATVGGLGEGRIFHNHVDAVGTIVPLGSPAAGTELVFGIHVNDPTTLDDFFVTPYTLFSGPSSRNPDGLFHAMSVSGPDLVDVDGPGGLGPIPVPLGTTLVGFEDILGAEICHRFTGTPCFVNDSDFNDLVFAFTGIVAAPVAVPEPAAILLIGVGTLGAALRSRARRRPHTS
jgi:hypothetical protein